MEVVEIHFLPSVRVISIVSSIDLWFSRLQMAKLTLYAGKYLGNLHKK